MNLQSLRRMAEPALRRVFHLYWRFARGMTLGVRGVVLDEAGRVFLVKHSYVSGWHLPGRRRRGRGKLSRCAAARTDGRREDRAVGRSRLHGVFFNSHVSLRDHVAVYVVRNFHQDRMPDANREIVACGFFETGALPPDTTAGTRLRIAKCWKTGSLSPPGVRDR